MMMTRCRLAAAILGTSLWVGYSQAAPPAAAAPASASVPATQPAFTTAHDVFQDQLDSLESDLAKLLQNRGDTTGPAVALVDYEIDVRLLQRWMLVKAVDASDNEALQAVVALRAASIKNLGNELSRRLQGQTSAMSPTQREGLRKLHQMTYGLSEVSIGSIDDMCKNAVTALILISGAAPSEVKNLPPMRPQPFAKPATRPANAASVRTTAELTRAAQEANVSAPLRRELSALSVAAKAAASNDKDQAQAAELSEMLAAAADLAGGIEHGTGIDAAARPKVETQLTEALALFMDPRTRTSGKTRIATLSQYRDTLSRVQKLRMAPAMVQKLSPAFVWINANPEAGAKTLDSIETCLKYGARYDARKEPSVALAPAQKRALEILQRQFTTQRAGFLDDVNNLGGAGIFATNQSTLNAHLEVMRQSLDAIEAIDKLPRALTVLLAFRPRPGGSLEKRAAAAVNDLALSASTTRDLSLRALGDIERLAALAEATAPPIGLPDDVIQDYTHQKLAAVDARRVLLLTNAASALASSKDIESSDLSKLTSLRDLFAALPMARDVEAGLSKAELLWRWVDWSISPTQLRALVMPYRDATAAAFEGFAGDNATPLGRWPEVQKRFWPILVLVKELGLYAEQCSDLPTGLPGEFAKLLTPMADQPFAVERYASLAIGVWQKSTEATDPKVSEVVFDDMLKKLGDELNQE